MTNSIFKTKEQYFSFRDAWASAVNNKETRSHLRAEHYILYNILCGKSFDRGFTPITNANKLQNGMYINHGLYNATYKLRSIISSAKDLFSGKTLSSYQTDEFPKFISPFNNTVTVDMIATIDLPEVKALYPNFGSGRQIADQIISGKFKPTNFTQIYAAMA